MNLLLFAILLFVQVDGGNSYEFLLVASNKNGRTMWILSVVHMVIGNEVNNYN